MYATGTIACDFQNDIASPMTAAAWTQSKVYKAFALREWDKFQHMLRCKAKKGSIMANSPFIPANFKEYVEHRLSILEESIALLRASICERRKCRRFGRVAPIYGGKDASKMLSRREERLLYFGIGQPAENAVAMINQEMDRCLSFRALGEFWVGEDLLEML